MLLDQMLTQKIRVKYMFLPNRSLWQYGFWKFTMNLASINFSKIKVLSSPFYLPTSLIAQTGGHLTSNRVNICGED